jgi:hypothetical protein
MYSIVYFKPLKQKRISERPVIDGGSVIQELGFIETEVWIYHWITTSQLQDRISFHEDASKDGWVIVGEVPRTPIHEALDLFNAQVTLHRYVAT